MIGRDIETYQRLRRAIRLYEQLLASPGLLSYHQYRITRNALRQARNEQARLLAASLSASRQTRRILDEPEPGRESPSPIP